MTTHEQRPQACARMVEVGWDANLAYEEFDEGPPAPSGDHLVVEVGACGVCYRDTIDRSGRFPWIQTPVTPGHEAAGRVIAVGPDVTEWSVGDQVATMHRDYCGQCEACRNGQTSLCVGAAWVFGLTVDGGYARYVTGPQRAFYGLPDDLNPRIAAVMHCTYGTAFRGMHHYGDVEPGTTILVTGANGGVGSAAIQVARALDATVIAVVRDEGHREHCERLGASEVIVSTDNRFHKQVGRRADIALDCVGQPTFNASVRSVRMGGGVTVIGNVVPTKAEVNLGYLIVNGITVVGSSGANRDDMRRLLALYADKPWDVSLHASLPLARADEAQRMVREGGLEGRIVLEP